MVRLLILTFIFGMTFIVNPCCQASIIIDDFTNLASPPAGLGGTPTFVPAGGDLTNAFVGVSGVTPDSTRGLYSFTSNASPTPTIIYDFRDTAGADEVFSNVGGGTIHVLSLPVFAPVNFSDWDMEIFFTDLSGNRESVYEGGLITRFDDLVDNSSTGGPAAVALSDAHEIEFRFDYTGDLADEVDATFGGGAIAFAAVPEPTTVLMFSSALFGLLVPRRRKK